jgi:hypothetical protein
VSAELKKQRRKFQTIAVTRSCASESAFDSHRTYSEIKDVKIDPFMRNLKFHEDIRPAYRYYNNNYDLYTV